MVGLSIRASKAWAGAGAVIDDARVVCADGLITSLGPAVSTPLAPDVEEVRVDGFLMPAGADRHVHVELSDPGAILRHGVTAVRDLAWPAERIFPLADLSEAPSFDGPLIRAAGPMLTGPGGYPTTDRWAPPGTGRELQGADDAAQAVKELAALGAAAIKVSLNAEAGPTPTDAELATICETARALDLPVTVHAQGSGQVERALGAGVDELAHTPWTDRLPDEVVEACARRLRIVSTLDIHGYGHDTPALSVALENLRRFHAAGGTVIYGTDLGNGSIPPGIHVRELLLLRDGGLSNEEILVALTRAPLKRGAPADLIVLGRDPIRDLHAFNGIRAVVRAGRPAG